MTLCNDIIFVHEILKLSYLFYIKLRLCLFSLQQAEQKPRNPFENQYFIEKISWFDLQIYVQVTRVKKNKN